MDDHPESVREGVRNLLRNAEPGWMPGLGTCFNVAVTPAERELLLKLLEQSKS